jgi:hypothetical protein
MFWAAAIWAAPTAKTHEDFMVSVFALEVGKD